MFVDHKYAIEQYVFQLRASGTKVVADPDAVADVSTSMVDD